MVDPAWCVRHQRVVGRRARGRPLAGGGNDQGQPYVQEGEYLEVESPRWLVHTWEGAGKPGTTSTVCYLAEPIGEGTRITLRHTGFVSREMCQAFAIGWETSFERLAEVLAPASSRSRHQPAVTPAVG